MLREIPLRSWRAISELSSLRVKTQHTLLFVLITGMFFGYVCYEMGAQNMVNTFMQTAYRLLIDTVFLTMAMTTLAGAFGRLLSEFGLNRILNYLFRYLMKPLYGLPGISFVGAFSAFLSENMAIIPFTRDYEFLRHFKPNQIPLLCNLGTSAGMCLFIIAMLVGFGFYKEALIGSAGALVGSVVSVRLMAFLTSRIAKGEWTPDTKRRLEELKEMEQEAKLIRESESIQNQTDLGETRSFIERFLSAVIDGGRYGVDIGLGMIPGVLVICSCLMILLMKAPPGGYSGEAFEGVGLIPAWMTWFRPIVQPVLGLSSDAMVGLTVACLGSAGAAVSLLQKMRAIGLTLASHEISVFAAFAILWSGFLATHVAIMDALGFRRFMAAAIWSHLFAGIVAGITANYLYQLLHYWSLV